MRLFSLSEVVIVMRGAVIALERVLKNWKKNKGIICWKFTILTPCLHRVGCEFWDSPRNYKGHISAVKCRQFFVSELVNSFIFEFKCFAPFWPSHTPMFTTYSCTLPPLTSLYFFPHALCSTYCYYGMLLSLYVGRMATLHSFRPLTSVTPQLCSSCWKRGLTRRPSRK